jgi:hypothetical protein
VWEFELSSGELCVKSWNIHPPFDADARVEMVSEIEADSQD